MQDPLGYKSAVLYELHVRSFCDSNGDGIGDFQGLTRKLGCLQQLGVTGIWLLPFCDNRSEQPQQICARRRPEITAALDRTAPLQYIYLYMQYHLLVGGRR